ARTRLEDVDREVLVELACGDALRGLADRRSLRGLEVLEIEVRIGGGGLDQTERANEFARQRQARDREIVHRALGLRAPQCVCGYLEFAHSVVLGAVVRHCNRSVREAPHY